MDEKKVLVAKSVATSIVVADEASYQLAVEFKASLKELREEIDSAFDPQIKAAHSAHKLALAAKAKYLDPVNAAEAMVKRQLFNWEEGKRKAAEEERRLAESIGATDMVAEYAEPIQAATYKRTWYSAECTDIVALCKAVASGQIDPSLVMANQTAINSLASSAKELFSVPGCKLVIKETVCSK